METYKSRNPSPKQKKKCRRHPKIDAKPGKDLCVNCLAADEFAKRVSPPIKRR